MLERGYSGGRAYMQSKLAQMMFTFDLAARLEGTGVTVNCLHPATYMATTMVREAGVDAVEHGRGGRPRRSSSFPQSPAVEGRSGLYFNGLAEARADPQAYDAKARAELWALSLKLAGLTDEGFEATPSEIAPRP